MKRILWPITGALGLALAVFGAGSLGLAISDREPPVLYEGARALSATVPQGGSLDVEFRVFRSRICTATAKRYLTDSAGEKHSIPSFTVGPALLAGHDTYRRSITIPVAAALGPATYQVTVDYECNVIHRLGFPITVVSPDIHFEITPNEGIVPFQEQPADKDG